MKLSQNGFEVNGWRVSPGEGLLSRNGTTIHVEPKVMEVLVYMASRQQEVISREDLERDVWRGALVGYDAVTATVIKLRKALEDNARHPHIIATIPKRGYKLIATVHFDTEAQIDPVDQEQIHTESVGAKNVTSHRTIPAAPTRIGNRSLFWPAALVAVFVIAGVGLYTLNRPQHPEQDVSTGTINKHASVVILPLHNLSSDPQQEYLSDGITDDITTALSQIASLRVVASQSAEHYKNKKASLQEISTELGVNYVVEGSVQKVGNNIRIIAKLTDVEKNHLVWAERFDRDVKDLFTIQDEIARHISDSMLITLGDSENRYIPYRPTNSFEAYDVFLQAQQLFKNRNREDFEQALDAYRRALTIDPQFGRAYGAMAVTLSMAYRLQWTDLSMQEARERSLHLARKAVELDKNTPQVFWSLGFVHMSRREFNEAEEATRKSITLSPSYADGYGLLALIKNWRGKAKEAEIEIRKAMTLNPYHTFDYPWNLGFSYFTQGRYEEAATLFNTALEKNETAYFPRLFLAASYVHLGRLEDAKWELSEINTQRPETTMAFLANTLPFEHEEHMHALLADLARAGMKE